MNGFYTAVFTPLIICAMALTMPPNEFLFRFSIIMLLYILYLTTQNKSQFLIKEWMSIGREMKENETLTIMARVATIANFGEQIKKVLWVFYVYNISEMFFNK